MDGMKDAILDWAKRHEDAHPQKVAECPMCQDARPIVVDDRGLHRIEEELAGLPLPIDQERRHQNVMQAVKTLRHFPVTEIPAEYVYVPGEAGAVLIAWDEKARLRLVRTITAPTKRWPR